MTVAQRIAATHQDLDEGTEAVKVLFATVSFGDDDGITVEAKLTDNNMPVVTIKAWGGQPHTSGKLRLAHNVLERLESIVVAIRSVQERLPAAFAGHQASLARKKAASASIPRGTGEFGTTND